MPDRETLAAYDKAAGDFAETWLAQETPEDFQAAVRKYFRRGSVADIGSGSGRDMAWLASQGFSVTGYDASEGLLAEAKRCYPELAFMFAALPALDGIADKSFDNVVCETVIMHLPLDEIVPSVRRLLAILKSGGVLYLSWRTDQRTDWRDERGRRYAGFDPQIVRDAIAPHDILLEDETISASSGNPIRVIVARKC
jgi:2-polyprenyl-3-methyl-5-hydroxy-6-metoxy-1,4-benzoquinol methylase